MKPTSYETAYQNKERVFYSEYTNTIRCCPENYLLATQSDITNDWVSLGDGACRKYFDKIQKAIDKTKSKDPIKIVKAISKVVPGSFKKHGYNVWQ